MNDKPKAKRGFAAMSPEMRKKITSMGGKASGGNFKNLDPEKLKAISIKGRASQLRLKGGSKKENI